MKQTAYFTYQLLIYVAIALMLVPGKFSNSASALKEDVVAKTEITAVATEDVQEDMLTDLLLRF